MDDNLNRADRPKKKKKDKKKKDSKSDVKKKSKVTLGGSDLESVASRGRLDEPQKPQPARQTSGKPAYMYSLLPGYGFSPDLGIFLPTPSAAGDPTYGQFPGYPGLSRADVYKKTDGTTIDSVPTGTYFPTLAGEKPPNYLGLAAFNCLCGCFVFGIVAIIFSLLSDKAYYNGNIDEARLNGRISMWLSLIGIVLAMVIITAVILYNILDFKPHSTSIP